jgi:hypothetical protein
MKKLFLSVIFATLAFMVNAQLQVITVPNTNYPFYSDIIKFKNSDTYVGMYEITPIDNHINLSSTPKVLDEKLVQKNLLKSLNELRKQYGKKPLRLDPNISARLSKSVTNNTNIGPITWATYASFNSFNYVRNFQNKEQKFCDYLFDVMSITPELFLELIDTNAKTVGFYYDQNYSDKTFDFIISIN